MNIKKVSFCLITAALTGGTLTSCSDTKYEDNAKAEAVKYLNGDELLKAERHAALQINYDHNNAAAISYWDSLLIEAKSKEAYIKGQQYIKDSVNKIFNRKEKFKTQFDIILPENIIEETKNEYAKYTSAEDFIKARENAPSNTHLGYVNNNANSTHYWNLITLVNKQNEAYQKGMADARNELKK